MNINRKIAYFSMEIAIKSEFPTYSGGLGVLAGDTIRSAADMQVPLVAVTLAHHKGYFRQELDKAGHQSELPDEWNIQDHLEKLDSTATVMIEGRTVHIGVWTYEIKAADGYSVPVYFLDTNFDVNSKTDRGITDYLYGGDKFYRLCQEVVLGIGGVRILRSLGYTNLERFHMNEGHAALLTLELLNERLKKKSSTEISEEDCRAVRAQCIFTTHTPVPAGHDQFSMDLVTRVLDHREDFTRMKDIFCVKLNKGDLKAGQAEKFERLRSMSVPDSCLNMTYLALNLSHYINGVAKKHGEVSRHMFGGYSIDSITNGVHAQTWVSSPFQRLFDRHIPGWREDNFSMRYALSIPSDEVWNAHLEAKRELFSYIWSNQRINLDLDSFTIGFARRATAYKRPDLFFEDCTQLKRIVSKCGKIQVIFAGKAHPHDDEGKVLIKRIFEFAGKLHDDLTIVYLENYNVKLGKHIPSGVDLWLNTPEPPLEASGTSGMKAALNGVPSLSVLDGWWCEGWIEGVTGWAIGANGRIAADDGPSRSKDAMSLYSKLEYDILPMYYTHRSRFVDIMRHVIALNGSSFTTQRMLEQYVVKAYL